VQVCVCALGVPRIVHGNGEEATCPRARGKGSRSRCHTHTRPTHHLEGPVAAREEVNILEGEVRHNLNHLVLFDTAGRRRARAGRGGSVSAGYDDTWAQTRMRTRSSTHRGAQRSGTAPANISSSTAVKPPAPGARVAAVVAAIGRSLCRRARAGGEVIVFYTEHWGAKMKQGNRPLLEDEDEGVGGSGMSRARPSLLGATIRDGA
jgi:hypothetical protein